jgi:hypothetical protein
MRRCKALVASLFLLTLAACALAAVKIADIKKDPAKFENQGVTVRGKVTDVGKLPFMTEGFYQVDDGSGSIMVVTAGALPEEGATVTVRGKVQSAVQIAGRSFGIVIRQEE